MNMIYRISTRAWLMYCASTLFIAPAFATDTTISAPQSTAVTLPAVSDTLLVTSTGAVNTTTNSNTAVRMNNNNQTTTNNGTISTTGTTSLGINSSGTNSTITNNNSISTTGASSIGISSSGATTHITNNGSIIGQSSGVNSSGITSSGANSTILNSSTGTISTSGTGRVAILSSGAGNSITNNGSITTNAAGGQNAHGISLSVTGIVTNNGNITTTNVGPGLNSAAILIGATASNSHIINGLNATISAAGNGIQNSNSTATDVIIENAGSITTTVGNRSGILISGSNFNVTNSGSITTLQSGGIGISASSSTTNGLHILQSGTIHSTGAGMSLGGENTTVQNTNTVTSTTSSGIILNGNNSNLTNSANGTITAQDGLAVIIRGTGTDVTNSGTLTGGGASGIGIRLSSTAGNNTLTNNGVIIGSLYAAHSQAAGATIINDGTMTGNSGTAIKLDANNNTVTLNTNSRVNGNIDFTGTTGGILQYDFGGHSSREGGNVLSANGGASDVLGSYTLEIENAPAATSNTAIITSGTTVAIVTSDIFTQSDQVIMNQIASQTEKLISHRQQLVLLAHTAAIRHNTQHDTQYASNSNSIGDIEPDAGEETAEQGPIFWGEGFGTFRKRPQSGDASESLARSGGLLVGIDLPENEKGYRYGIHAGGFASAQEMGENTFRNIRSKGVMLGGYIAHFVGTYYMSIQMALGYSGHDSKRDTGTDLAHTHYNSAFVSPAITIMRPFNDILSAAILIPSLTLRYTGQHATDYTEKGSVANQSVEERDYHTFSARLMMDVHFDSTHAAFGTWSKTVRLGLEGETELGGNEVDLSVLGTNVSFDPKSSNNTLDSILGLNVAYALDNGPEIYGDAEASIGLNKGGPTNNAGGTVRIGARWDF